MKLSCLFCAWTLVLSGPAHAGSINSLEKRQTCGDSISNCVNYGNAACTQYHQWAQHNCAKFCGFCTGGDTSVSGPSCVDVIDNCAALGPNICQDYVEFVHINCQKSCNLCGSTALAGHCQDKLSNCAAYGKSACGGEYEAWAKDNCPGFCNLCPSVSGFSNACYYQGKTYQEGETWTDGCEKNCTCVDGRTGNYLCQSLCKTYAQLPSGCHMETPPGECCAKPVCPPAPEGCLYKGQVHGEGQQWKDGCEYLCQCKDGKQGYYECRAMCLTWQLTAQCHLDRPAPGLCCPTPNCPANVRITYPDGYVPM